MAMIITTIMKGEVPVVVGSEWIITESVLSILQLPRGEAGIPKTRPDTSSYHILGTVPTVLARSATYLARYLT